MAEVDPDRIREAVDNLVDNALRFAPAGTPVVIAARRTALGLVIEVRDAAPASRRNSCPTRSSASRGRTPGAPAATGARAWDWRS